MVNIEGLLGKVANNGATLLGILAHGEWNTLVQAVRELQQIVASDERLSNMQTTINQLVETVNGFEQTYDTAIQSINNQITNDRGTYYPMRFGGVVEDDVTVVASTYTGTIDSSKVFYIKTANRFAYQGPIGYYGSWNGMFDWCSDSYGTPISGKVFLHNNAIYVYDSVANQLKQANSGRYASLLSEIEAIERQLEEISASINELDSKQGKSLTYAPFDGFVNGTIQIEQVSLSNFIRANSRIYFYEDIHKFILRYGVKYYSSWSGSEEYNDPETNHPYTNKLYIYANQQHMYDFDYGVLKPISIGLVGPMTQAEYEALGADVDDNLLYAIYEE